MKIEDIRRIVENKVNVLNAQIGQATIEGDLERVVQLQQELDETNDTLRSL